MSNLTLNEIILHDLYRYTGKWKKGVFKAFFRIPGFRYIYFFRKCNYYANRGIRLKYLYYRYKLDKCKYRFGLDIPHSTKIGYGFYIGHHGAIVINEKAVIGNNVNIAHGVTIGQTNRGEKVGVPIIGDKVWIGAHAIIVGKITIGNNALIAPGAYVNFDVPENSVVIGNPGTITSHKGSEGYINNIYNEVADEKK